MLNAGQLPGVLPQCVDDQLVHPGGVGRQAGDGQVVGGGDLHRSIRSGNLDLHSSIRSGNFELHSIISIHQTSPTSL